MRLLLGGGERETTVSVRVMKEWGAFALTCCCGKAVSIELYECVSVALGIQHEMRMRHVACTDLQYFSTLSHK